MIDLTSSLYLGLGHPSGALRPWRSLTLGRPAALATDPIVPWLEARLGQLLGTEATAIGRSTTHLFLDLSTLAAPGAQILLDSAAYPALRWGAERAAGTGRPVRTFARGDLGDLARGLTAGPRSGGGSLILTDGLCCGCGAPAPLRDYVALARRHGANLVIDDTQAVGVLGAGPGVHRPWGRGGGGTARWLGLAGTSGLIVVASLAKAFGAPLATIAGRSAVVDRWKHTSETRVHSSPPASAELAALDRALATNHREGDRLRSMLLFNIGRFRQVLGDARITPLGGLFPIQSLALHTLAAARELDRRLRWAGVLGVVQGGAGGAGRVTFVLTAAHPREVVERAAELIAYHAGGRHTAQALAATGCERCGAPGTMGRAA
ncbi:MAG: aminotransferase class I/II-fold pyridoxal phosphate-dependent enzyme [Solirubrobacterales bacterium]|nr:aminotransferase class I/II-fold pyridoxal phosphate-dependent enzyme [Solirubrobacterales bacterium]